MKKLIIAGVLLSGVLNAQSSFRIFDDQMNDVTSGVVYLSDTNAAQILCNLTVENIDSVSRDVTAGRLVLTAPSTSSNAMIWGMNQYPPNADSTVISEIITPGGTQTFQGLYFPNNNGGIATINYCFWDRYDMNNNSCVTVTYDNFFPASGSPIAPSTPKVNYGPNPATTFIGIGWSDGLVDRIDMYSSDGRLISSVTSELGLSGYQWELAEFPEGIYYIHCSDSETGWSTNFRFIHTSE